METYNILILVGIVIALLVAAYFVFTSKSQWAVIARNWLNERKAWVASGIGFVILVLYFALTRKKPPFNPKDKRDEELREKLAEARIQAALEIGKAKGREDQVKAEVEEITTIEDKNKQLQQLADLVQRTRRRQ